MRVLLLEDDERIQDMWATQLYPYEVDVVAACCVEQAQAEFRDNPNFDAVVVDGALPDGPSTPFVEEVKQSGFSGSIICASGDDDLRRRLKAAGCTHQIEKYELGNELRGILGL